MTHTWVVVLAAGEGRRLATLTTGPDGVAVPKQFCSVDGRRSLLQATVARAATAAPPHRTLVVVAAHHRGWWAVDLADAVPRSNILVQPALRGTAVGILLALRVINARAPRANVLLLPSDHYVADEPLLHRTMVRGIREAARGPVLLGIAPEGAETSYGWIVPAGQDRATPARVRTFVEKPPRDEAKRLSRSGGLWSSMILAAEAQALTKAFASTLPLLLRRFESLDAAKLDADRLRALYRGLPDADFSRDVLGRYAAGLRVLRVPPCGWSDLGTPRRIRRSGLTLRVPNVGG